MAALTVLSTSHSKSTKMPSFFKKFGSNKDLKANTTSTSFRTSSSSSVKQALPTASTAGGRACASPFATTTATRRPPPADTSAPPAYSPPAATTIVPGLMHTTADTPYAFLTQVDTIFLIDDSGSMAGRSWRETKQALAAIAPICTAHDEDGIDIYFLNNRNPMGSNAGGYTNVTTTAGVEAIFNTVRPLGGTPTGTRLNHILKPYLAQVEESLERQASGHETTVKPLNIIVITDGVPSDDVETIIVSAARKLDAWGAEPAQLGIQFFQVGNEKDAAEDLQELDDALSEHYGIRDMVDTVPWTGQEGTTLTAQGILKCVLGALIKKHDRRRGSDERLRQ